MRSPNTGETSTGGLTGLIAGGAVMGNAVSVKQKTCIVNVPKAVKIESLDKLIQDGEGNQIELYQMIADDNAIDITARLEARFILQSYPHRFVRIAYKKYAGYPLTTSERNYLYQHRRKALQKRLSLV